MKNIKLIIGIIIGFMISIGISSAYKLNANEVTYDKKTATLESNTVSGAIDELGVLATTSMSEVKSKLDSMDTKIDKLTNAVENLGISTGDSNYTVLLGSANAIQNDNNISQINFDDYPGYKKYIILTQYTGDYSNDTTIFSETNNINVLLSSGVLYPSSSRYNYSKIYFIEIKGSGAYVKFQYVQDGTALIGVS